MFAWFWPEKLGYGARPVTDRAVIAADRHRRRGARGSSAAATPRWMVPALA